MGLFSSFFFFPRTKRELKAKRGGVLGREERERGPAFCILFLFLLFFLFPFFPFFVFTFFYETKRNEMKLCGSYSSFMNDLEMSPKRISDNLYIENSTSFIYIIFNNSLLRLRVTRKLCPWTCKLSLSFFMSVLRSSDEESKRGGIINGTRPIYIPPDGLVIQPLKRVYLAQK